MERFRPGSEKQQCRAYCGDMSQLSFVRRSYLMDGRARMMEALDFDNGSGLAFTVLPSRGMDIAWARYRGVPISFMTKAGVASPECYDARGMEWLWNFFGGMLTTCGMSNAGDPCEDIQPEWGTVSYGLHGRLNNTAASQVSCHADWDGGEYCLEADGLVREGVLHGQNLAMRRTISTALGKNEISVCDVVENEGFRPRELMLFYHINIGYPILDRDSILYLPEGTKTVTSASGAPCDPAQCRDFCEPYPDAPQHVFLHTFPDPQRARVAVYQPKLELGVGLTIDPRQLPYFSQWKRMASGDYVLGLEPGNCLAIGRANMKEHGIEMLEPGEKKRVEWTLSILDGTPELKEFLQPMEQRGRGSKI